mmetsp:Transcript_52253/g.144691  ORF Transcript_52253/g.144691 Transcript_52253/m.144691 type:complete len:233 (+) Transcript_52253:1661-2359(+)
MQSSSLPRTKLAPLVLLAARPSADRFWHSNTPFSSPTASFSLLTLFSTASATEPPRRESTRNLTSSGRSAISCHLAHLASMRCGSSSTRAISPALLQPRSDLESFLSSSSTASSAALPRNRTVAISAALRTKESPLRKSRATLRATFLTASGSFFFSSCFSVSDCVSSSSDSFPSANRPSALAAASRTSWVCQKASASAWRCDFESPGHVSSAAVASGPSGRLEQQFVTLSQ